MAAVPLASALVAIVLGTFALRRLLLLAAALAARDVHMVGRYGRWEYAAIEDALVQGTEAVERVMGGVAPEVGP